MLKLQARHIYDVPKKENLEVENDEFPVTNAEVYQDTSLKSKSTVNDTVDMLSQLHRDNVELITIGANVIELEAQTEYEVEVDYNGEYSNHEDRTMVEYISDHEENKEYPVCYLPVEQAIASILDTPSFSPRVSSLTYIHEENLSKFEFGGSEFGGYPSLKQWTDSYDIKESMSVHYGFVKGASLGHQPGFDIDYSNLLTMKSCRGVVVASIILEVTEDALGDEFKGYIFKIMGGCDNQGFQMKQGVLNPIHIPLLLHRGTPCFRDYGRPNAERRRKSVHGYTIYPKPSVLNLVVMKKCENDLPILTDTKKPRMRGPKRASKIRKLFNLSKEDDVRKYVNTYH
ncbi:40S ribosomal protein S6 [Capsicum annuum]|nr:40S ribosomal protein S6 [Capsicum annuum]